MSKLHVRCDARTRLLERCAYSSSDAGDYPGRSSVSRARVRTNTIPPVLRLSVRGESVHGWQHDHRRLLFLP
jgi:hypothetical protein